MIPIFQIKGVYAMTVDKQLLKPFYGESKCFTNSKECISAIYISNHLSIMQLFSRSTNLGWL